jgi:hypothetical protein
MKKQDFNHGTRSSEGPIRDRQDNQHTLRIVRICHEGSISHRNKEHPHRQLPFIDPELARNFARRSVKRRQPSFANPSTDLGIYFTL